MKHVTLLFLRKEGRILLAMKKRGFGVGKWNGVGGKVEPGESPEEAAIRECQEEIAVTPRNLHLAGNLHFFDLPDVEHYCYVYVATEWEGEPSETEEMRPQWFAVEDIPYDTMWADDRLWLPELIQNNPFKGKVVIENDIIREWRLEGAVDSSVLQSDSITEISERIWQHLIDRDWDTPTARSLAISISLEANELLEHYQWNEQAIGNKEALAEELADIFIYALEYAHVLGIDPAQAIRDKLAKTALKYPAEQFKGKGEAEKRERWLAAKAAHRRHKKSL
jgi:8-oxo-dGTP diphosphatase